jgi:RNA polymerase sigma-70 factor (ECF subfamily)
MELEREAKEFATGGEADEILLRHCAMGDSGAFRVLFERYEPLLMRFFARTLGSYEDAQDAVVDTLMKLWRSAPAYQEKAAVRTWLYPIAHRTAIDALRRRRRHAVVDDSVLVDDDRDVHLDPALELASPEAAVMADDQRARDLQALRAALAQLAPSERSLLVLFYLEGYSYAQIREVTGESMSCIKSRLYRARQRLKAHLQSVRDRDEDLSSLAEPSVDDASGA